LGNGSDGYIPLKLITANDPEPVKTGPIRSPGAVEDDDRNDAVALDGVNNPLITGVT
jgi:hypothetical protein